MPHYSTCHCGGALDNATDPEWRNKIIIPLLAYTDEAKEIPVESFIGIVDGWLSGLTYHEIATACKMNVEVILSTMCHEVGFELQDSVSKLIQIALAKHGGVEHL